MMVQKKKSSSLGLSSLLSKYAHEGLSLLTLVAKDVVRDIPSEVDKVWHLRQRADRYIALWTLIIAALVIGLFGLGSFIESFVPTWRPGLVHLIIGSILILIVIIYKKSYAAARKDLYN